MPDRESRKRLLKDWKAAERTKAESELPASKDELRELFSWVDERLDTPCDHTMRNTLEFIRQRSLDEERTVVWLHQFGGYCDCEVVANVEDTCPAFR
jgi:hypothetical protein